MFQNSLFNHLKKINEQPSSVNAYWMSARVAKCLNRFSQAMVRSMTQ